MKLIDVFRRANAQQPERALFSRARLHMTLWYSGVLGVALLLFGIGIYLVVQQALMQPIETLLAGQAMRNSQEWQQHPDRGCPFPGGRLERGGIPQGPDQQGPTPIYMACTDASGRLIAVVGGNPNTNQLAQDLAAGTLLQTALQKGKAGDTITSSDGSDVLYRYAVLVPDPSGTQPLGVIVLSRSIADIQAALIALRNTLLGLGTLILLGATLGGIFLANRALAPTRLAFARQQAFIADASHELRTPLTLLRTDAEVLLRSRDRIDGDDVELLEDMVAETDYLTRIATNLLTLARLDAGATHLELDVIDLSSLAAGIVQRMQAYAAERGVIFRQELEQARVLGDCLLLEQVLLIILDNAVKYSNPGGTITVGTQRIGGRVQLSVQDTGIGIPPEHLPHLGERFYRVDKARSRESGGTGLGLSLARGIIAAHGGTLELASTPGQGTTVTITLPPV